MSPRQSATMTPDGRYSHTPNQRMPRSTTWAFDCGGTDHLLAHLTDAIVATLRTVQVVEPDEDDPVRVS